MSQDVMMNTLFNFLTIFFRMIPSWVRGKERLARLAYAPFGNLKDLTIVDRYGYRYKALSLSDPVCFSTLIHGAFEPLTHAFLHRYLRQGMTYVDIGANIGVLALPATKIVGQNGCVLGVEASSKVFAYLQHNIAFNGITNMSTANVAAYKTDLAAIDFYDAPNEKFGMGSLSDYMQHKPAVKVAAKKIDTMLVDFDIGHVDMLKLDIEGGEVAALIGAKELLCGDNSPLVLFEFCQWAEDSFSKAGDSQEVLRDYGYQIWTLNDYLNGAPALCATLRKGFNMLVASKEGPI